MGTSWSNRPGLLPEPRVCKHRLRAIGRQIVRTANAVIERIQQDPRIKATDAIEKGDVIKSKTKMITVAVISTSKNGMKLFKGATDDEPKEVCGITALEVEYINGKKVP